VTTYVVLSKNGSGWNELARIDASSDQGAVRKAVDGKDLDGEYVAVPLRSFQVRRAISETKTVVTFPKVTA
jgi:hypothetical protein